MSKKSLEVQRWPGPRAVTQLCKCSAESALGVVCVYVCPCVYLCLCVQEGTELEREERYRQAQRAARMRVSTWGQAGEIWFRGRMRRKSCSFLYGSRFRQEMVRNAHPAQMLNTPNPSALENCHLKVLSKTNTNTILIFAD